MAESVAVDDAAPDAKEKALERAKAAQRAVTERLADLAARASAA